MLGKEYIMTIDKNQNGNNLQIKVSGRLDTTTAPELEEVIKASIEGIEHLELDFSDLEYVSSAGLRVLLSAQKSMNKQGDMIVTGANDTIMEIFEVTGFSDILTIK
jgi:anti-sigma B factor antagonist